MFGTLKPHACGLGCDGRRAYGTFYCGVCKGLGDHFGQLSRALLSYDAVFLAIVADGLVEEGAAPDRCRCPMLPVVFRPTVRPDSPAVRYAAAMQVLLSDQWLADRAGDGGRVARAARPLVAGKVETARAVLGELGISLAELSDFDARQLRVEAGAGRGEDPGLRGAAEPTAAALEIVFGRMALLPGVPEGARSAEGRAALGELGRRLGSVIYLIDALDDLAEDHRGGAFNPCLVAAGRGPRRVSWPRVEMAWGMLHDDLAALGALVAALPLRRHRDLVASVVAEELPRLARAAAKRAHGYAREEDARVRAARQAPGLRVRVGRGVAALATLFVLIGVWLASIPALAMGRRPPGPRAPDASSARARADQDGGPDGGRGAPPEQWEPRLPPPPRSAPATPRDLPDAGPGGGSRGGDTGPATPPAGQDGAAEEGSGSCFHPVDLCTRTCKGCFSCCDACRGGDCSGCAKPCGACGGCSSCCKGSGR